MVTDFDEGPVALCDLLDAYVTEQQAYIISALLGVALAAALEDGQGDMSHRFSNSVSILPIKVQALSSKVPF